MSAEDGARILIAGGGVAALEALLALRADLDRPARIDLLAPDEELSFRQFAVAEPFGFGEHVSRPLAPLVEEAGGSLLDGTLADVDVDGRVARTGAGEEIDFDRLLIAIGARPSEGLPGARTYRGPASNPEVAELLLAVARGESRGLAFAVPASVHWALPIYELALLGAAYIEHERGAGGLHLVTAEAGPLPAFGREVSARIAALLEAGGVQLHAGVAPARMVDDGLALVDGTVVPCDATVALPRPRVPEIAGIPQDHSGFIDTDPEMRVEGCAGVYAAGDATWFPIKQGGLASQQADVAARSIARSLGAPLPPWRFHPVLRAAMLTPAGPLYLRGGADEKGASVVSGEPLWWPPAKVAGRRLAPFLGAHDVPVNQPDALLADLAPADAEVAGDHEAVLEMALSGARIEADGGNYATALRWLSTAERLELVLPPEYARLRDEWRRALRERLP
jgi:sulfide:quinone oxidoreductase